MIDTDWLLFFLVPALLFISISGGSILKSKEYKQVNWFWVLVLNFTIGVILAMWAALPLSIIYLIFFQNKNNNEKLSGVRKNT